MQPLSKEMKKKKQSLSVDIFFIQAYTDKFATFC